MLVEPELLQQMRDAADAHGASVAVWLRQAMWQVTLEDFPASWHMGNMARRAHGSGDDDRKVGLCLDEVTSRTLEILTQTFHRSAAEIIRQLIAQASPEDFPSSWHMAAMARRPPRAPLRGGGGDSLR
jgi:hypothetical protein